MDDLSIIQDTPLIFYEQFLSPEIFLHPKRVSQRPRSPEKEDYDYRCLVMSSSSTTGLGFQVPDADNNLYDHGCVAGFKPNEFCDFIHNGNLLNFELQNKKNIHVMPTQDLAGSWQETSKNKRPMGDGVQELKKQCVVSSTKPKSTKSESTPKKDPLSIAAKNRRERISERLKALQELVPNGSKVDLVTMLEKAISYVKFLQLQVKVLATDEFWPSQGGKAPELSQVKEAIDAILGS